MIEYNHRAVRMGVNVGGTHTKCVVMDNEARGVIGKNQAKTAHDDKSDVAVGVTKSLQDRMRENNIAPEDVVFVVYSTTQTTSAFIEGDVASVGVVGVIGGGLEGLLAKHQLVLKDVILDGKVGRMIEIYNTFIKRGILTEDVIGRSINELLNQGSQVIVASTAFGVDSMDKEMMIYDCAEKKNVSTVIASDITKLYGLTRRIHTAVINASILPKMMMTVNVTESSVRMAGVTVPLTIVRGDDGVMEINEMRKCPILIALSGPAASVVGSLMYLRAPNAIYLEVGGTTTNVGVIKSGCPGAGYIQIGERDAYIGSLDVRILDYADGSIVRVGNEVVVDIGPHSTHIAGCEYTYFTPKEEIENPQTEMVNPKPGDPNDYMTVRLKNGKRICLANTCATNVLGLIEEQYSVHDNVNAARKAMQPVTDKLGITVEKLTTQILDKDFEKVNTRVNALAEKYQFDHESMKLVDCGGEAVSLALYCTGRVGLQYSVPENAEVIFSIEIVLSMMCDVIKRVIPNPSQDSIRKLEKEAVSMAVSSGTSLDTAKVHIEIDNQTGKITAITISSTEVKTTDLLKECDEAEAYKLATQDLGPKVSQIALTEVIDRFYVYQGLHGDRYSLRIVDKKGFVKARCSNGNVVKYKVADYKEVVEQMWKDKAVFKTGTVIKPDSFACVGPHVGNYSAADLDRVYLLMDPDLDDRESNKGILTAASVTEI